MKQLVLWRVPTRGERLNAHRLFAVCQPNAHVTKRVGAALNSYEELVQLLDSRRAKGDHNRFAEEAYLAAYEAKLKETGRAKLSTDKLIDLRQRKLGLDPTTELYKIWSQCVAAYHSTPADRLPHAVKLMVGGPPDTTSSTVQESVAALLADSTPFRRTGKIAPEKLMDLRATVIRQWVVSSGVTKKQDLELVERLIAQDVDHQLSAEPAESFRALDSTMIDMAKALAAKTGLGDDSRFVFYVFRCLQRIAAYEVQGRVQWRSMWLRGAKGNPRAIPGASKMQKQLGDLLRDHVLEQEAAHSGAKATARTYRLRLPIKSGTANHHEAAKALGLELNKKGTPKK